MNQYCYECLHQEYDKEYRLLKNPTCETCVVTGEAGYECRSNWEPKNFVIYCEMRYGNMFHSVRQYKEPFKHGEQCYCCKNDAVKRIDTNIWGTVCQFDVCQKHSDMYDGKNVEGVEIESGD